MYIGGKWKFSAEDEVTPPAPPNKASSLWYRMFKFQSFNHGKSNSTTESTEIHKITSQKLILMLIRHMGT
jgi:hypothetical protein